MMRFTFALVFSVLLFICGTAVANDKVCGRDAPCVLDGVDGGTYYLGPDVDQAGKPLTKLFVFFNGHNGSGAKAIGNKRMISGLSKAGFRLVSPDGPLFNFRGRKTRGWAARKENGPPRGSRNDVRFVERVLEDIRSRSAIDENETVLAGFSSGASMAWYVACYSEKPLAGILAVAGGLRRPLPKGDAAKTSCPGGPRKLLHIHGFTDKQVPLEGRAIRSWHQGDVFEGLSVLRNTNGCHSKPDIIEAEDPFWCRTWSSCGSNQPIRFCLHAGGHGMPSGWLSQGLIWLQQH